MHQQVLELRKKVLGPEHPDTIACSEDWEETMGQATNVAHKASS